MSFKQVNNYIRSASFLFDNIVHARKLSKISIKQIENKEFELYKLDYYRKGDLEAIRSIHRESLNSDLTHSNRLLIKFLGHKLCFIIRDNSQKVIACILFYFDKNDIRKKRIHLGTIVVSEEKHGCGLGTLLIKHAIGNLECAKDLIGISSRVSLNNVVSLRLHRSNKFIIKEQYYDNKMHEMRAYLVRELKNHEERGAES